MHAYLRQFHPQPAAAIALCLLHGAAAGWMKGSLAVFSMLYALYEKV